VGDVRGLRLMMRTTPEQVVREGFDGMVKGKSVVIPGMLNRILVFLLRFSPRNFVTGMVRRIQSR
jgi:short-subunit dehydrogenase